VSVRIRLTRMGRRNRPYYRVVVADSRSRRDGCFIEQIGTYDPVKRNDLFQVKEDRILHWLRVGAKPSDTVKNLLSKAGIMLKWHLENSNLSEEKKKQELQKWELAQKAKAKPAAPKKEKEAVKEEKETAAKAEAPAEAAAEEKTAEPGLREEVVAEEAPVEEKAKEKTEKEAEVKAVAAEEKEEVKDDKEASEEPEAASDTEPEELAETSEDEASEDKKA